MKIRFQPAVLLFSCVALAGVLAAPLNAAAAVPAGSPLAMSQHPRLLITPATLPGLQAKLADPAWRADFQAWVKMLDANFATAPYGLEHIYAAGYAFLWLTNPIPGISYGNSRDAYANRAKTLLLNAVGSSTAGLPPLAWGFPLTYDWINPTLSASDKATLIPWFQSVDKFAGGMLTDTSVWNTTVVASRAAKVIAGLAIYGDSADNTWALASMAKYQPFFRDQGGVTTSESVYSGSDGGGGQGFVYWSEVDVNGGSMNYDLYAEEAWRTANGIGVAAHYGTSETNVLRYHPKYLADLELPWATPYSFAPDGMRHSLWKSWASTADDGLFGKPHEFAQLSMIEGMYATVDPDMAGLAAWLLAKRIGPFSSAIAERSGLQYFIYGRKDLVQRAPSTLDMPLSKGRKDGVWFLRSAWEANDGSMLAITAPKWMTSNSAYSNNSPGGFEIYHNGPQVIRQGMYGHDWGSSRSGPQNIMIFPDRTLTAPSGTWDTQGGMRLLATLSGAAGFTPGTPADVRGETLQALSDGSPSQDADYVSIDLTRAYDSTVYHDAYNPARISNYVRQFIYFRSDASHPSDRVVVMDRVTTTDTKFEKRWLFHTATEPAVNGAMTPGPARGITGTDGKWSFAGTSLITATNTTPSWNGKAMDGKTWLTPLLPASRTVVKVGGPNTTTGKSWTPVGGSPAAAAGDSHEYESPYGVQGYLNGPPEPERAPFVGSYRIEIIPAAPALADTFLNVVEVGDARGTQAAVQMLSGTGMVGAQVGDRIAVFGSGTADVKAGDFTVARSGAVRMMIADLVPYSEYVVGVGASAIKQVATAAGTVYVDTTVTAGQRVTIAATGYSAPPPAVTPAAPTSVRIIR